MSTMTALKRKKYQFLKGKIFSSFMFYLVIKLNNIVNFFNKNNLTKILNFNLKNKIDNLQ